MKKQTAFLLAAALIFASAAVSHAAGFDNSSVIVVTQPENTMIRMSSDSDAFDGMGITKVENLDSVPNPPVFLTGSEPSKTLKLTLGEPGEENVLETLKKLRELPNIKYAEPNYIFTLLDSPDDPEYVKENQYSLNLVNAPAVWDLNIDCSGVTVAIIDSGALCTHPDLAANIWTNPGEIPDNGIDDDDNGYIDDIHGWDFVDNDHTINDGKGHGTHVAGIISAQTNNGIGVASLARNAKIMPLRTFDNNGNTSFDQIYKAIAYAHSMGADIVNNSYATTGKAIPEDTIQIFKSNIEKCGDMLFTAAAGNSSANNDASPVYPASYDLDNIITVANSTGDDKMYSSSNYGAKTVDIAAPGVSILSTYNNNGYTKSTGTSMACPLVSSAAAVVKAVQPELAPSEIAEKLISSADKSDSFSGKVLSGGRLNAYAALPAGMTPMPTVEPTPEPTAAPTEEPTPEPTVPPTEEPTVPPTEEPTVPPTNAPENTPTAAPTPASSDTGYNSFVKASRRDNEITVTLNPGDEVHDEDIAFYAAIMNDGIPSAVLAPDVVNMTAKFSVPEGTDSGAVKLYIWDANMRPYTASTLLSDAMGGKTD